MNVTIRPADATDADLAAIATVANEVSPEDPTSVEAMRWADATYPGGARWVADLDGRVVGVGTVGRIYMYAPDFDAYWGTIHVLPEVRRRGIGSALLDRNAEHARHAGKTHLHVPASEARPDGIDFLEHRGFTEYDRSKTVRLDLRGMAPPEVVAPAGIDITSLAVRPDLIAAVHAVAVAAFPDIPGGDRPMDPGDLAEFRARDVDRPDIPPAGFMVALDRTDGSVVGYAALSMVPGSTTAAWHDMTAVRREQRGRGIARALKLATIGWAIQAGLETLDTGNDVENAPVRALNQRLGYLPLPDEITLRGPIASGIMEP
jgi:GNAT superfamily N-acetyltransferase